MVTHTAIVRINEGAKKAGIYAIYTIFNLNSRLRWCHVCLKSSGACSPVEPSFVRLKLTSTKSLANVIHIGYK